MHWVVQLVSAALAIVLTMLGVACAARLLNAIPVAAVRRWIVILATAVFGFAASLVVVALAFTRAEDNDLLRSLSNAYRGVPTPVVLCGITTVLFACSALASTLGGVLPQRGDDWRAQLVEHTPKGSASLGVRAPDRSHYPRA